ncbi:hypothetical protein ACHWQZ_G006463 [Mnemiopsis leidyi]
MEDDMKLQIDKLMKALNVPSSSDISTTTLNKLNKAPIAGFLVDMVKILEQNLDFVVTKVVKEAVKAVGQEEEKSKNLIIYGIEEDEDLEADPDLNEKVMNEVVKSICGLTIDDGLAPKVKAICRIGQFDVNKSRPIRAQFINSRTVDTILKNASRLKTKPSLKSVYVLPDRTKEQRAAHAKLVHKMKELISRDNSKHYFIRGNVVKCVDKK